MAAHGGTKVVVAALAANLGIAILKLVAALFARSAAMFAEFAHSVADAGNQVFLLLGIKRSKRAADERHEFGYGAENYFWGFIVAVTMFSVGATYSIYEGIHKILHPGDAHAGDPRWAYAVLGGSIFLESLSMRTAWKEFQKIKAGRSLRATISDARDPVVLIVLFEDAAALAGLTIALGGIFCARMLGLGWIDGVASVAVGLVLLAVAIFAARETKSLLLGESVPVGDRQKIIDIVSHHSGVKRFVHLRTMHVGPEDVIAAIKVVFPDDYRSADVARKIDEIESALRKELPQLRRIFIEAGSDLEQTYLEPGEVLKSRTGTVVATPEPEKEAAK